MTSKEALEVNKSLKILDDFWTKCRKGQHTNTTKFCSECGQRLDWEENVK